MMMMKVHVSHDLSLVSCSVTAEAPPPIVHIINGYITVQTHPQEHGRANQHRTFSGSSSWSSALTATALCVQILLLLLS